MELLKNYSPNLKPQQIKNYSLIINKGDTLRIISSKMVEKGIIKNKEIFEFFAKLSSFETSIKSGQYNISSILSIKELLDHLNLGKVVQNRITITEGMNNAIFYEILKENKLLLGKLDFKDFPTEGYLAPDTYFYEKGEKRLNLLNRIIKAQSKKINDIFMSRHFQVERLVKCLSEGFNRHALTPNSSGRHLLLSLPNWPRLPLEQISQHYQLILIPYHQYHLVVFRLIMMTQ